MHFCSAWLIAPNHPQRESHSSLDVECHFWHANIPCGFFKLVSCRRISDFMHSYLPLLQRLPGVVLVLRYYASPPSWPRWLQALRHTLRWTYPSLSRYAQARHGLGVPVWELLHCGCNQGESASGSARAKALIPTLNLRLTLTLNHMRLGTRDMCQEYMSPHCPV